MGHKSSASRKWEKRTGFPEATRGEFTTEQVKRFETFLSWSVYRNIHFFPLQFQPFGSATL